MAEDAFERALKRFFARLTAFYRAPSIRGMSLSHNPHAFAVKQRILVGTFLVLLSELRL